MPEWSGIEDFRGFRGRRHEWRWILEVLFCGMLGAYRSLGALELWSQRRGRRISETTLFRTLSSMTSASYGAALHAQVRRLWRAKALKPVGFRCSVVAIDNKTLFSGVEKVHPECQTTHPVKGGPARYHLRTVGAMLTSTPLKPILHRQVVPAATNDMAMLKPVVLELEKAYPGLMDGVLVSLDAGFCSFLNASWLNERNYMYVIGLKENQPDLIAEARRVFACRGVPEAQSPWESYQGRQVRRQLFRTSEMQDWTTQGGCWNHLRQVWCVVKEERRPVQRQRPGRKSLRARIAFTTPQVTEVHYFLTNGPWNYLTPDQILALVRGHWGIENQGHWMLDMFWDEDAAVWCRLGEALVVLSLMRAMALNMLRWLKERRFRQARKQNWGFKEFIEWVKEIMAGAAIERKPALGVQAIGG